MKGQQSVDFTMLKLKEYRRQHQERLSKTYWWKFKTIKYHKNEIAYYDQLLDRLGNRPTLIDVALTVPDGLLARMGW